MASSRKEERAKVAKARHVVIKIGSRTLAADSHVYARLAASVAEAHAAKKSVVLVSSGAIALGTKKLGFRGRPKEMARLQAAAAAGQAGEDGGVVGEHGRGDSPAQEGVLEGVHDVGAGDGAARDARDGEPGVVVEEVEDLHVGAVGQLPVGGVGLPAFVVGG